MIQKIETEVLAMLRDVLSSDTSSRGDSRCWSPQKS